MFTSTAKHDSYLVGYRDLYQLFERAEPQARWWWFGNTSQAKGWWPGLPWVKLLALLYNFPGKPAIKFTKEIKTLKEKLKRAFFSYLSLSKVLAEYGLDFDNINSIPLFKSQIHEIQDDNKVFKCCMEEILGRLCSYGTLQPDSLEAMRNEYVIALLHVSIHIVIDITNKKLSMYPQYGIVDKES